MKFIIESNYEGIPLTNVKIIIKQAGLNYAYQNVKDIYSFWKGSTISTESAKSSTLTLSQKTSLCSLIKTLSGLPEKKVMLVMIVPFRNIAAEATHSYKYGLELPESAGMHPKQVVAFID